jgi:hypothetical protein
MILCRCFYLTAHFSGAAVKGRYSFCIHMITMSVGHPILLAASSEQVLLMMCLFLYRLLTVQDGVQFQQQVKPLLPPLHLQPCVCLVT